jgi:hypothetical protein
MNVLVFIAVLTNMVIKLGIALTQGNAGFMIRMGISFLAMVGAFLLASLMM